MRDYACVSSQFWTGDTGRRLRRLGPEVQVVALYLITAPSSNMIGLYYLPLPTLCHETGLSAEAASRALQTLREEAPSKPLRSPFEGGFAHYDAASEVVWVPEMARFQIGETISPKDNRHKAVLRELEKYRKCPFYKDFHTKYGRAFNLPTGSPFEGASKPLRSQEQEQDQEQEQESSSEPAAAGPGKGASETDRKAPKLRARDPLFDAIAEVTGSAPAACGSNIGKVRKALASESPPFTPEEVREFGRRFRELCSWAAKDNRTRPELNELQKHIGKLRAAKKPCAAGSKPREYDRQPPTE